MSGSELIRVFGHSLLTPRVCMYGLLIVRELWHDSVFEFVCRNQQQSHFFVLMFLIPHLAISKNFLHLLICQTKLNRRLYLRKGIASVMSPVGQVLT